MSDTSDKLITLYQEMFEHTHPKCMEGDGSCCTKPGSCCTAAACHGAIDHAWREWGVHLQPTGHANLPLMGPTGCIAEPHLRPLCTVHQCDISGLGYLDGDEEWTTRYFELRDAISTTEFKMAQGHAHSLLQPQWEEGDIPGTWRRKLGNGAVVTLGTSDAAYPPGEGEGRLNLNTSALFFKVEVEDYEGAGFAFPLGWWAKVSGTRSMHKAKGQIDRNGYTLPAEMLADYWQERVIQMEAERAKARAFCEEFLSRPLKPQLIEVALKLEEESQKRGWSGEPK